MERKAILGDFWGENIEMDKSKIIIVIMALLCAATMVINHYFDHMKLLGMAFIIIMVTLGIVRGKILKKK
ncbi:MAG: hypothetical protein ACERKZ_14340 [Lachnotalea sp.]